MNIITDALPSFVIIKDKKYTVRCDFKTWLRFYKIINSDEPEVKKIASAIALIYVELPENIIEAVEGLKEFYSGELNEYKSTSDKKASSKKTFDFEYDSELIYSAFLQQYNIDLAKCDMHWWKFKALFHNLTEETKFIKVVQYRGMDTSKMKDKEQKKFYEEMKRIYKLPDNRTKEEKENDFVNDFIDNFI